MHRFLLLSLVALGGVDGCAKSIDTTKDGGDTDGGSQASSGEALIDATSETWWTYLDLAAGEVVEVEAPEDSDAWSMGFRRQVIQINGGVSGTGGMELVELPGVSFDDELEAPDEGWKTDEPDADGDGDYEYAFNSWFEYDSSTHELTAADIVYIVKNVDGALYKLQLLDYYDAAGTGAMIHLQWGPLDAEGSDDDTGDDDDDDGLITCNPDGLHGSEDLGGGVTFTQLSTGGDHACFSFEEGLVTESFDFAMQKWVVQARLEVAELAGEDFDSLSTAPADGYVDDALSGAAFDGWYDYDGDTHEILANDIVYVVKTEAGAYYKMQFTTYYPDGDSTEPHYPGFQWAPVAAPE